MRHVPSLVVLSLLAVAVSSARGAALIAESWEPTARHAPPQGGVAIPARPAPEPTVLIPVAERAPAPAPTPTDNARWVALADIYADLPASRAAKLVAALPRKDAASLLGAMEQGAASAVLTELDDETAVALTLALAETPR